jgi:hypothetical protein
VNLSLSDSIRFATRTNRPNQKPTGVKLGHPWHAQLGRPCCIEIVHLDDFVPICKWCELPQSGALFGGLLGSKMDPAQLKLYTSLTDLSARIHC